jgi:MFS family permease
MNWGQLAEILTLFFVPVIIQKLGIRFTMILGLLALFLRYVAFYFGSTAGMDWLFFAAILVHGIIYGFFSVGGQIYINKVAPSELKAQAQGFIFLVTFGLGIIVGNFINAWLIGFFTVTNEMGASHIQWDKIFAVTSGMSLFVLLFFSLLFNYKKEFYERVPAGD